MSRHVVAFHSSNTYKSLGAILFDSYEDAVVKLEEKRIPIERCGRLLYECRR